MKKTTFLLVFLSLKIIVESQTFITEFTPKFYINPHSILEYKKNNFIICGITQDEEGYGNLLLKINYQGDITKIDTTFKDYFTIYCFSIGDKLLTTGGIDSDEYGLYFSLLDTNFNTLWHNEFYYNKISGHSYSFSPPIIDNDSNIIIAGYHTFGPNPFYYKEPIIYKFNLEGDSIGYKNFDTIPNPSEVLTFSNNLFQNPNSGSYFINIENDAYNSLCYKVNKNLKIDSIFQYDNSLDYMYKTYSKFFSDTTFITSITKGVIISNTYQTIFLMDTLFNIIKEVDLSFTDFNLSTYNVFHSIDFTDKNNIYAISNGPILSKLDSNLDVVWQKYYELTDSNLFNRYINGVFATSDKGAIILIQDLYYDSTKSVIIKVDSLGNLPLNIQEKYNIKTTDFSVFPNPATDYIKVFKVVQVEKADFVLYNSLGQIVLQETLTENITELQVADLPKGLYIYNILQNNEIVEKGKIIKE